MAEQLRAEIRKIIPSAVYMGAMHDQDVEVDITGDPVRVFDPNMAVTIPMLGTVRNIDLWLFGGTATVPSQGNEIGIRPADGPHRVSVTGTVLETSNDDVSLAVGDATVEIELSESQTSIEPETRLTVRAAAYLTDVAGRLTKSEIIDHCLEQLESGTEDERARAARYLGRRRAVETIPVLIEHAQGDEDNDVRVRVIQALGRIGRGEEALGDGVGQDVVSFLEETISAGDESVREAAERALYEIQECPNEETTEPFCTEASRTRDE